MEVKSAAMEDIFQVTELRMSYLKEAYGGLSAEEERTIRKNNIKYLKGNLNHKCFIVFVRENGILCSCAYLNIMEKAANLRFMNGIYGEIYGVFTLPEYRGRGMATELMKLLIKKGEELQLPFIRLDSSAKGYHLYKRIGFQEVDADYKEMRYLF